MRLSRSRTASFATSKTAFSTIKIPESWKRAAFIGLPSGLPNRLGTCAGFSRQGPSDALRWLMSEHEEAEETESEKCDASLRCFCSLLFNRWTAQPVSPPKRHSQRSKHPDRREPGIALSSINPNPFPLALRTRTTKNQEPRTRNTRSSINSPNGRQSTLGNRPFSIQKHPLVDDHNSLRTAGSAETPVCARPSLTPHPTSQPRTKNQTPHVSYQLLRPPLIFLRLSRSRARWAFQPGL